LHALSVRFTCFFCPGHATQHVLDSTKRQDSKQRAPSKKERTLKKQAREPPHFKANTRQRNKRVQQQEDIISNRALALLQDNCFVMSISSSDKSDAPLFGAGETAIPAGPPVAVPPHKRGSQDTSVSCILTQMAHFSNHEITPSMAPAQVSMMALPTCRNPQAISRCFL
jgi:hypothetical protein